MESALVRVMMRKEKETKMM